MPPPRACSCWGVVNVSDHRTIFGAVVEAIDIRPGDVFIGDEFKGYLYLIIGVEHSKRGWIEITYLRGRALRHINAEPFFRYHIVRIKPEQEDEPTVENTAFQHRRLTIRYA